MAEHGDEKRPQFGNRFLTDPGKVFEHNAWDNVAWDEEQENEAKVKVDKNSSTRVTEEKQELYESKADHFWDEFYSQHQNRFFKDRHWLFTEFPELLGSNDIPSTIPKKAESTEMQNVNKQNLDDITSTRPSAVEHSRENAVTGPEVTASSAAEEEKQKFPGSTAKMRILEVGCGVGNTVFPVLQTNNDPSLFVYGCDLSSTAVQILKDHPDYDPARCHAFVCDVSDPSSEVPFPETSLDIVVLIFVLSAIHPDKMQATIMRLASFLKPGGLMVFRDYGRYDLAQLRFKDGQCLEENFYVRGDGTRVYFFTQEDLRQMFTEAGLHEEQNLVDRRLQVNRVRQLKMYRVWIQCKYRKPEHLS